MPRIGRTWRYTRSISKDKGSAAKTRFPRAAGVAAVTPAVVAAVIPAEAVAIREVVDIPAVVIQVEVEGIPRAAAVRAMIDRRLSTARRTWKRLPPARADVTLRPRRK